LGNYDGMTVNERLFEAKLLDAYTEAKAQGGLAAMNAILRKIDLRQDENGMNWSLDAQD
jgi:hypothetical protein